MILIKMRTCVKNQHHEHFQQNRVSVIIGSFTLKIKYHVKEASVMTTNIDIIDCIFSNILCTCTNVF